MVNCFCNVNLDTENLHKQAATVVAARFGKIYNLDLRYKVLGAPEMDGAKMIVNELKLPIPVEEYIDMVHTYENKFLSDVDVLPGSYYISFPVRVNIYPCFCWNLHLQCRC